MAVNLQPPSRLGKREGYDALAQSMGKKEHYHRHHQTNPRRISLTLQGVR